MENTMTKPRPFRKLVQAVAMAMALALVPISASAESDAAQEAPSWTLQVDPLTTLIGFAHLQLERRLGDSFSIYAGPSLRLFSPPFGDEENFVGYGGEIGFRWYFLGGAPEGFWVLARTVAAYLSSDLPGGEESGFGGYSSGLVGYTAIFGNWFVLSGGAGFQYLYYTINDEGPSGPFPALHTTVGVAF